MCGHTDRVPRKRRRHGDGDGRRYNPLLELSEENSDRRALPEIPTREVSALFIHLRSDVRGFHERNIFIKYHGDLFLLSTDSITNIYLPVGSKWLYVGTEKGNIHIVHTDSFTLSGYIIHWNKAVEL